MKLWISLRTSLGSWQVPERSSKFGVKFTTLFQSSWFDWQLRNEIAKFVVNFGNFKRTSETVCQKFCETHCKGISQKFSNTVMIREVNLIAIDFLLLKLCGEINTGLRAITAPSYKQHSKPSQLQITHLNILVVTFLAVYKRVFFLTHFLKQKWLFLSSFCFLYLFNASIRLFVPYLLSSRVEYDQNSQNFSPF